MFCRCPKKGEKIMYEEPKMEKLTINLPPVEIGRIDLLVEAGLYPSRTEFIRTSIRKTLDSYQDYLDERLKVLKLEEDLAELEEGETKKIFVMGVVHLGKENFERALKSNKKLRISVVGLVVIDRSIPASLVEKAVEKIRVYGVLKASPHVKRVLENKR